jgi:mannose-6-phosphate isomerase-like protein (cupin superfamily)
MLGEVMKLQGKVWGKTQSIFQNHTFELHRIEVKKGGFCSTHKHQHKYNAFYIEKGKLKIKIHQTDYDLVDETIISTGELTVVTPDLYHSFEALESTICYEIYWGKFSHDDIQRKNVGGVDA